MNFLSTQNLVNEHIQDLLCEADAERLERLARTQDADSPAAWRRLLGRGVRGLSLGLRAASTRLDPSLDRHRHVERTVLRV